jgi:hypothetical protein
VNGTDVYNSQATAWVRSTTDDRQAVRRSRLRGDAFGGFLGIGEEYSPLPWSALRYDTEQGGYVVDIDKETLKGGPRYAESDYERWEDPEYTRGIDDYYSRYASLGGSSPAARVFRSCRKMPGIGSPAYHLQRLVQSPFLSFEADNRPRGLGNRWPTLVE